MRDKAEVAVRRILNLALEAGGPGRRDATHEAGLSVARSLGGSGGRVLVSRTIDSLLAGETDIDSAVDTIVSAWLRRTAVAA